MNERNEARLKQAYRMRAAFHSLPEHRRIWEYCKWLDDEVARCERVAGNEGIANVLRSRESDDDPKNDSYAETDKPMSGR